MFIKTGTKIGDMNIEVGDWLQEEQKSEYLKT